MQLKLIFEKEPLKLPKRYEILERQIKQSGSEVSKIVRKIEKSCSQIENLLGKIQVGGTGQFQLFLGESGSGKTTFLRTLPNFYKDIHIETFKEEDNFEKILETITKTGHFDKYRIFIIDERDNPKINLENLRQFFEKLRILFRKDEGQALLIWPITDEDAAKTIGDIAWKVGKESICPKDGPIFKFDGLPKETYFEVADDTVRNLNNGENLDSFGINKTISEEILRDVNTIGEYYSHIEERAFKINESKWKILESKVKPKVWILLSGDSSTELDRTVKSLTSGIESKIDIDRMCAYLDDETNTSAYLNDWRARRSDAGFLFRFLDVRLFSISPNLALSSVRVYGDQSLKTKLNKQSETTSICHDAFKRSDFFQALNSQTDSSRRSVRTTAQDTQNEYLRLQQTAKSGDKLLNKAFSNGLEQSLNQDGITDFVIKCEKQELQGTNLKPDVQIDLPTDEVVCLELTWRTTGAEIKDEISSKQNTLTSGHIQRYILDKVMEYIKELGI